MKYNTTFVSAFYTLEQTPYFKTELGVQSWSSKPLIHLIKTGIYLCLYIDTDSQHESMFYKLEKEFPNFKIMPYRISRRDLWVSKLIGKYASVELPAERNRDKDTLEYMSYMHSRFEFIEDAVSENPWDTTHFAWIDFNSVSLFNKREDTLQIIRNLAEYPFPINGKMYVPGCWPKFGDDSVRGVASSIYWRFCGSFFMGDAGSINQFAELYREHLPLFLEEHGILTWEVNFWAWLEWRGVWTPTWYHGDHNDRLVALFSGVSADNYSVGVKVSAEMVYNYPDISPFLPGSASYLEFGGKHYLNTRFVNYWMFPTGYYRFHNADMVIENRNFLSELDAETMQPLYYEEMGVGGNLYSVSSETGERVALEKPEHKKRPISEGLEDIRLYNNTDTSMNPRFIATNVDYSANGRGRMIVGTYNLEKREYEDCACIVPPDANSWCEKNWVPIIYGEEPNKEREEHFIYKWSPMEIGRIVEREREDGTREKRLEIVATHPTDKGSFAWLFGKLRGSSVFVDMPREMVPAELNGEMEYLVGLTHFSEEHSPRHYYHVLVLLEKRTLKPVGWSKVFYFDALGIEFCIGMRVQREEARYQFWISRFDRDPKSVVVESGEMEFICCLS